jgi:hypothetical protein
MALDFGTIIFASVILGRVILPLFIIRWPLPAIIASLVLDAVDQTIFQQFTTRDLAGYQGYDKALDIYYLSVAYISSLRNWVNLDAFRVDRFLYYYRLVGVLLFEMLHWRPLLLIFPNTFEYFFIFYEVLRARWDPKRFAMKFWVVAAALIWIVIKLPQEYWIHVAQMDVTDFVKETLFGVPATASFGEAIAARPWVVVVALAAVAVIVLVAWRLMKRLPPADHRWRFKADPLPADTDELSERLALASRGGWFGRGLIEKIVLVGLISVISAQILPNVRSTKVAIIVQAAVIVAANALVSQLLARRRIGWESGLLHFLSMLAVNAAILAGELWLLPLNGGEVSVGNLAFLLLLITLIVTLYDRNRVVYDARLSASR